MDKKLEQGIFMFTFKNTFLHLQMFRLAVISCVLAAALAATFSAELDGEWESFKTTYSKRYQGDVDLLR